jgi:hypothetical protein
LIAGDVADPTVATKLVPTFSIGQATMIPLGDAETCGHAKLK